MALTQIKAGAIADDAIDSSTFADGSIDNAHLAANSVDSDQYVDGSIDNAHLADDAVDGDSSYIYAAWAHQPMNNLYGGQSNAR